MVTAGVYLIVRLHPLFMLSPLAMQVVGWVGGLTALYAAITAIGQTDLKRVLAYSTMSQLGLMFLACGAGAFYAAMFHLTTHAFIKALLFLSAGNVLHAIHGENEMKKMGGLSSLMPKTNVLFLIGMVALSGIPPLAAFFSKDLILEVELDTGHLYLYVMGLIVSLLTAFYLTRAYCLTFLGKAATPDAHEAPNIMVRPLYILAGLSVIGGLLGFMPGYTPFLEHYLNQLGITHDEHEFTSTLLTSYGTWIAFFLAMAAITYSWKLYGRERKGEVQLLKEGFYLNDFGKAYILAPLSRLSSGLLHYGESKGVQGSLNFAVESVAQVSQAVQKLQNGQIRTYAAWMVIGAAFLLFFLRAAHV
jgi:NADH-quinone oxidoreductase subunit L